MSKSTTHQSAVSAVSNFEQDVVYVGYRRRGTAIIEKYPTGNRLRSIRSRDVVNHSPSGFEWGYGGSGPAQLALALLLDYTDDREIALAHYNTFKHEVVAGLDCSDESGRWRLSAVEIEQFLRDRTDE